MSASDLSFVIPTYRLRDVSETITQYDHGGQPEDVRQDRRYYELGVQRHDLYRGIRNRRQKLVER